MTQVEVTVSGRIARLRLNAPPLNILTAALQNQLREAFEALRQRDDHNVVLLTSAVADVFSSGADVAEHTGRESCQAMLHAAHALIAEVLRCPVPTICIATGSCLGGAFELALACDQIVATPNSVFGTPEINLGCYPPAALVLMPQKLPILLAAELIQSGRQMTATELTSRGAGLRVTGGDDPIEESTLCYASLPRGPLVEATRLLRAGAAQRFLSAVGPIEAAYLERLLSLGDSSEGPKAFFAKRKPVWDHIEYR